MSEATKSESAQAEIPGTAPAKVEAAPEAKAPARDYEAELKAANAIAAKAQKHAKEQEAKLADLAGVVEKIKGAFGGDKVEDPAARIQATEAKVSDYERKFKSALQRNALAESLVRAKVRPDLLDHALRLVPLDGLEFDLDAGAVKNADAVDGAVTAFKEKFASVYFQSDAPPPAPSKQTIAAGAMPPNPGQPKSTQQYGALTSEEVSVMPLEEIRKMKAQWLQRQ